MPSPVALVAAWNALCPPGTLVGFEDSPAQGAAIRSRTTSAAALMDGEAIVWIEAQAHCVALEHCMVVPSRHAARTA